MNEKSIQSKRLLLLFTEPSPLNLMRINHICVLFHQAITRWKFTKIIHITIIFNISHFSFHVNFNSDWLANSCKVFVVFETRFTTFELNNFICEMNFISNTTLDYSFTCVSMAFQPQIIHLKWAFPFVQPTISKIYSKFSLFSLHSKVKVTKTPELFMQNQLFHVKCYNEEKIEAWNYRMLIGKYPTA